MMKMKFFGLALAAITCVALNGNAQTTTTSDKCCANKTECTQQCKKDCKKDGKQCKADKKKGDRAARQSAFDKMTLTADQKARLEQFHQKNREARKAQAEARKADKQRGDSAMRADREAAKRQYLTELKEIVGPDNYVIFLEESFLQDQGPRMMQANDRGKMAKDHKGSKMERKAGKMDRKDRPSRGDMRQQQRDE